MIIIETSIPCEEMHPKTHMKNKFIGDIMSIDFNVVCIEEAINAYLLAQKS